MKKHKIRIVVVDDHFVVRMGLSGSINMEEDMMVVAEASNGQQAIQLYRQQAPDIVLMDLRLPVIDGTATAMAICKEYPEARIIMLSTYDGDEEIYRSFQAGVRSYLLKSVSREELLAAIRAVHAGQRYIPPAVAARLAERVPFSDLSVREMEVLGLIVKGMSNKEIAAALSITEVTTKLHVGHILTKLKVNDRTQAATSALQRGIIRLA
jgi:two-component system, NarL family, response regulator